MTIKADEHEMYISLQTEEYTEWVCTDCDRYLRVSRNQGLQIFNRGEQTITHKMSQNQALLKLVNSDIKSHVLH